MDGLKSLFDLDRYKQKLGPLPIWAWGLIIGVLVVAGYYLWQSRSKGPAAVGTNAEDAWGDAEADLDDATGAIGDWDSAIDDWDTDVPGIDGGATSNSGSDGGGFMFDDSGGWGGGGYDAAFGGVSDAAPVVDPYGNELPNQLGNGIFGERNDAYAAHYTSPLIAYNTAVDWSARLSGLFGVPGMVAQNVFGADPIGRGKASLPKSVGGAPSGYYLAMDTEVIAPSETGLKGRAPAIPKNTPVPAAAPAPAPVAAPQPTYNPSTYTPPAPAPAKAVASIPKTVAPAKGKGTIAK